MARTKTPKKTLKSLLTARLYEVKSDLSYPIYCGQVDRDHRETKHGGYEATPRAADRMSELDHFIAGWEEAGYKTIDFDTYEDSEGNRVWWKMKNGPVSVFFEASAYDPTCGG